jgi:mannose-6-phosphate isomerase-like protein (cupin superfamily)
MNAQGKLSEWSQFMAKPRFFASLRMTTKVVLVALLCLVGCASASHPYSTDPAQPDLADLLAQLERNPIGPGEELRITKLVESHEMSGLLVQVRGSIPPHFHKRTQEIVHLIRGEGLFQLGTERIPIKTGAVMRIPPGQVHTFTNRGPAPAVFFVVTTPRWDEQDRFMTTP